MIALFAPLVLSLTLSVASPIIPKSLRNGLGGSNDDFIQKNRKMTDSVISILRSLTRDSTASEYINRMISDKNNVCLKSLEEAIDGIERTTKLVENNKVELLTLIDESNKLLEMKDPAESLRQSSTLLRMIGPLSEKLVPETSCQASPSQATESLEELTVILYELADLPALGLRYNVRSMLRETGDTVHAVNTFLNDVRRRFENFGKLCARGDRSYGIKAINAFGDLMTDMADLLRETGAVFNSYRVRKGKLFIYKIAVQLRKMDLSNLISMDGDMDCSSLGDFSTAADSLGDLASVVEEVGLENLQQQLGVDFGEIY